MPMSQDRHIATSAGDGKITILDAETKDTLHVFSSHKSRVKRLAVSEDLPYMLFSAGEDGYIM